MIQLIIEKDYLKSFALKYNAKDKLHNDFCSFLKYIAKPEIYTDIKENDFRSFKIEGQENLFLELLCNSNKPEYVYCERLYQCVLDESFLKDKNVLKLFFLNASKEKCSELSNQYGFDFLCLDNFNDVWPHHYFSRDRDELELSVTYDPQIVPRFDSWEVLNNFSVPVTNIIVSDPYLLSNKNLINVNIVQLLRKLLLKIPKERKINIIICTSDENDLPNTAWETRQANIRNGLNEVLRADDELFVIRYSNSIPDHSRGIFTNYWYINSGHSFNFYSEKGIIQDKCDNIYFKHLFYKGTINTAKDRLKDVKGFIEKSLVVNNMAMAQRVFPPMGVIPYDNEIINAVSSYIHN